MSLQSRELGYKAPTIPRARRRFWGRTESLGARPTGLNLVDKVDFHESRPRCSLLACWQARPGPTGEQEAKNAQPAGRRGGEDSLIPVHDTRTVEKRRQWVQAAPFLPQDTK